jgi:undecaprenyl-diphosphatase
MQSLKTERRDIMDLFFDSLLSFDLSVFQWIQSIQNGFLDVLMAGVTTLGNAGAIFIVLGFVLLFTKKYRNR